MKTCVICGRQGSRGYSESDEGLRCSNANACEERRRHREESTGLWFDENRHRYKLDGKRVPGVTTIIGDAVPKPYLVGWGINSVAAYGADHLDEIWAMRGLGRDAIYATLRQAPYSHRDNAGIRGSSLHQFAQRLIETGSAGDISNALLPWVESAASFLRDYQPRPVLVEAAVASRRWGYAGTLDAVFDFPDGERRIIDWKTSKRIYSEIALQLAGYRGAEFYLDGREERALSELGISSTGYAVLIRPEGYKVHPVYVGEEVHRAFTRLLWVRDLVKDDGTLDSWLGQPLPSPPHKKEQSA